MKKIIIGLVLLLATAFISAYLLIPDRLKIGATISLRAALPGISRTLKDENSWEKWWPGKPPYNFNGKTYFLRNHLFNAFDISILDEKDSLKSRLLLVMFDDDSLSVSWKTEIATSTNPLKRVSQYRGAKKLENDLQTLLTYLKSFAEKTENIYGMTVIETKVTDSILISTRTSFDHEPDVNDINGIIQKLKKFIIQNNAKEKNSPMLNVRMVDSSEYEAMVAIPVDRELPATNEFAPKWLFKGGNILEAQIVGGPSTIKNAFNELENYRADFNYTSPAIPFQLLVTDRAKEADTTKWITKLYYPVF